MNTTTDTAANHGMITIKADRLGVAIAIADLLTDTLTWVRLEDEDTTYSYNTFSKEIKRL